MRILLKSAASLLFTGMFFTVAIALGASGNANQKPSEASTESRGTAPEIHPVTAGAAGILVVGGIALLTARRRRAQPARS